MDPEKIQKYLDLGLDWLVSFTPKIILALFILWLGFFLVRRIIPSIKKLLNKAKLDLEIVEFLSSVADVCLKLTVILIAAGIIGVKLTALLGVLAALGFAIGMALQGFLGNFASGLTILFLKPYKIGDLVTLADRFGRVEAIQIFNTTLITPNDKTLVIPNGQVTDNVITNFSAKGNIRLELNVTMPYEESFPKVQKVILAALEDSKYVLNNSETFIGIENYDSHNLIVAVRPFIHPDNYWAATYEIYALIKKAYYENNIKAAYSEGVELGPIGA